MAAIARDFYLKNTQESLLKNPSSTNLKKTKFFKEDPVNILGDLDKDKEISKSKKEMKESIKNIHDQFELITFSTFFLLIDPLLEKMCCPVNLCF
jgi:hypothetical protein